MPLDSRSFTNDRFPRWAEEPPTPAEGSLVPGSQFHEEQWIMAAGMLARGNSFLQVSRAMVWGGDRFGMVGERQKFSSSY